MTHFNISWLDILTFAAIFEITSTTISGPSYTPNNVNEKLLTIFLICDVCIVIVLCIAAKYWNTRASQIVEDFEAATHFPTDYTLEVDNVPPNFDDDDLFKFFNDKFNNNVAQINVANKMLRTMSEFDGYVNAAAALKTIRTQ